jgi:hypothetical protein
MTREGQDGVPVDCEIRSGLNNGAWMVLEMQENRRGGRSYCNAAQYGNDGIGIS